MSRCPPHTMKIPESIAQYMQTTPQWSRHPKINDEIHLILIKKILKVLCEYRAYTLNNKRA